MFDCEIENLLKILNTDYLASSNRVNSLACWIDIKEFTLNSTTIKNFSLDEQNRLISQSIGFLFKEIYAINDIIFTLKCANERNIYNFLLLEHNITTSKQFMTLIKKARSIHYETYKFLLMEMPLVKEVLLKKDLQFIFDQSVDHINMKNWKAIHHIYANLRKNLQQKDIFFIKEYNKLELRIKKIKIKLNE